MTLSLAWAGPWNARSAIAVFGAEVVAALRADGHRVEVLRTEEGSFLDLPPIELPASPAAGSPATESRTDPSRAAPPAAVSPPIDTPLVVRPLAGVEPHRLRRDHDAVVANLGDHFGYHGALAPFLLANEAVVILHDAFMANFCSGWAHRCPDVPGALRAMVAAAHGPDAMPPGAPYWLPAEEMMRQRPMLELFCGHATAAIVHAGHYRARVAAACAGPVTTIPLAYRDPDVAPGARTEGTLEVATFGLVNGNKRIAEVIKAIDGSDRLRAQCRYRVVGEIAPAERQRLEAGMRAAGGADVAFTGWVDDAALRGLLAGTDVVCCLRHPVLEGGSASLVAAMLAGRTVLVSDQGVYAELPDDVALKCQPGAEADDIRRHLEAALDDRAALWARGERARAYARRRHSPVRYARALVAAIGDAQAGAPAARTAAQFGRLLASLGLGGDDPAARAVADTLAGLLGGAPTERG